VTLEAAQACGDRHAPAPPRTHARRIQRPALHDRTARRRRDGRRDARRTPRRCSTDGSRCARCGPTRRRRDTDASRHATHTPTTLRHRTEVCSAHEPAQRNGERRFANTRHRLRSTAHYRFYHAAMLAVLRSLMSLLGIRRDQMLAADVAMAPEFSLSNSFKNARTSAAERRTLMCFDAAAR
jgi:hypothetical protein